MKNFMFFLMISLTCSVAWGDECNNWIDVGGGKQCISCECEVEEEKLKDKPKLPEKFKAGFIRHYFNENDYEDVNYSLTLEQKKINEIIEYLESK